MAALTAFLSRISLLLAFLLVTCHSALVTGFPMSLHTTPVYRNLQTRVTFLYLEFEDLFVVVILAVLFNILGRFLDRELFGIPMSLLLQYGVPVLSIPFLILFKYGKPGGYLMDWLSYHFKPRLYCCLEADSEQTCPYLQTGEK